MNPKSLIDYRKATLVMLLCSFIGSLCFSQSYETSPATRSDDSSISFLLNVPTDSTIDLRPYVRIFADTNRVFDWRRANDMASGGFFSSLDSFEWAGKFTRGKYAYWITIDINTAGLQKAEHLTFYPGIRDSIHIWQLQNKQPIASFQVGNCLTKPEIGQKLPFPTKVDVPLVFLPNNNYRLLIRIVSELAISPQVEPRFFKPDYRANTLAQQLPVYLIFHGLFFGIILFMAVFSAVQFFQNRDWAFLWYTCYLLVILLFYLRDFNTWNPIFHVFPRELMSHTYYLPFAFGLYFFYILFVNTFLNTRTKIPRVYRFSRFVALGMLVCFVLERAILYVDPWLSWQFIMLGRFAFLLASCYFLFLLFKERSKLAFFILSGTLVLVLSNIITLLLSFRDNHNWGLWDITHIPSYVGVLLEILLFSTGLGYKTRLVEVQKTQAEAEAKRLLEMDKMKSHLFTNITHEFRTPLTVILGLAGEVEKNPYLKRSERLQLLKKNGRHLLTLVNHLLDLASLDHTTLQLQKVQDDVISFLQVLTDSYHSYAFPKNIGLQFFSEEKALFMDFDPTRLQQIIDNLLSNAFKFTPEYGKILVFAKREMEGKKEWLEIRVKDTGYGIPVAAQARVFDRFYQADNALAKQGEGTGIGLSLVKELVELMEGRIWLESNTDEGQKGRGTTFFVRIPVTRMYPVAEADYQQTANVFQNVQEQENTDLDLVFDTGLAPPEVLIIEDNADVIYYLKSCLSNNWRVRTAQNGVAGLAAAIEHIPDVIVSDVMMPEMDGFALCEQLKTDERTSHIPILLLTAKATQADKLEGLSRGADAYLLKPFDKKELLLQLDNFLKMQERQRAYLHSSTSEEIPLTAEQLFLKKVNTAIEDHLDDSDFGTPQLLREIGLSRVQLHRKLKTLTNTSTAVYIRTYRLQKAKTLLENTSLPVSEIAWSTGFSNLSWFAQAFRETYGMSPSETRK